MDSRNNALLSSLRADLSAWQSIRKSTAALESTFLHNAEKSQKIHTLQKVDSRIFYSIAIFATAKKMDCHATASQCLAMTEKATASKKVDSRDNAKNIETPQAAGFLMKKWGCAAFCAEISLVGYRTNKRQTPRFFAKSQRQIHQKKE